MRCYTSADTVRDCDTIFVANASFGAVKDEFIPLLSCNWVIYITYIYSIHWHNVKARFTTLKFVLRWYKFYIMWYVFSCKINIVLDYLFPRCPRFCTTKHEFNRIKPTSYLISHWAIQNPNTFQTHYHNIDIFL